MSPSPKETVTTTYKLKYDNVANIMLGKKKKKKSLTWLPSVIAPCLSRTQ